jgi:two-component system, chemotaxis family, sensor histidine kinase and response regulator PixL
MQNFDPEIRDQAYQFFIQEAPDFLQVLETGLLNLRHDHTVSKIHDLMRAAHSLKGGAASVGLESITAIAHHLESVLRALYRQEVEIDRGLEDLLLQAYDCLQEPMLAEVQLRPYDGAASLHKAEPIFAQIAEHLGEAMVHDDDLPTAAELGVDIVDVLFTSDVTDGLERLAGVLANPDMAHQVAGEIRAQAEVFCGVGELVNLPGFIEIAKTTLAALINQPQAAKTIGQLALADFRAAQAAILAGDRTVGGHPSADLQALTHPLLQTADASMETMLGGSLASIASVLEPTADALSPDLVIVDLGIVKGPLESDAGIPTAELEEGLFHPLNAPVGAEDGEECWEETFAGLDELLTTAPTELDLSSSMYLSEDELEALSQEVQEPFALEPIDGAGGDTEAIDLLDIPLSGTAEDVLKAMSGFLDNSRSEFQKYIKPVQPGADAAVESAAPTILTEESRIQGTTLQPHRLSGIVKVDLQRLERLNNLVGQMVTHENTTMLQTQQLQGLITSVMQRSTQFERITRDLQDWKDRYQRKTAKLHPRSPLLKGLEGATTPSSPELAVGLVSSGEFDPLQMDLYSPAYNAIHELMEEVSQLCETVRDMAFITQQTQQTQRQKQQTLKQVRNDLLRARMMPIGDILQRFPRMVRDLAVKYEKQVTVTLVGTHTLLDKAVLERLHDPLIHLVRNAFDHGIELPDARSSQGKPREATIEIRAYHRGNQTYIEVCDDGKGIDVELVRQKAVSRNLISAAEAAELGQDRLYELLFEPGFSTAATVSELSGRGVGLDAVKVQIQSLKGSLALTSELGKGSKFILRFPLTLTVANLLVFSLQSHLMAIPVDSLIAIAMATADDVISKDDQEFYYWKEQQVPVYSPSILLQHYPLPVSPPEQMSTIPLPCDGKLPLLLIAGDTGMIALRVEQVVQEQELVIKPFGGAVVPPTYLTGCTILGDGTAVPVIDGSALIARKALPQAPLLPAMRRKDPATGHGEGGALHPITPQRAAELREAFSFRSAEMSEISPTELPHPRHLAPGAPSVPVAEPGQIYTVLVIDDSLTMRQALAFTLKKAGYRVVQARDGRDAMTRLHQSRDVQAVFCDVEMPRMNGFEFLRQCHQELGEASPPVIMLSSRDGDKYRRIAQILGARNYLTKPYLEHTLLGALEDCLQEQGMPS